MLPVDGDSLFLIVPTETQQYEEDRENRIRTRYATQRALIDQGFAAEPGYLLSSLIGRYEYRSSGVAGVQELQNGTSADFQSLDHYSLSCDQDFGSYLQANSRLTTVVACTGSCLHR